MSDLKVDHPAAEREPDPWTSRATLACSATGEHQPHPWTSAVAGSVNCPGLTPEQWATARRGAIVCQDDCCNWRTIPWPAELDPHLAAPVAAELPDTDIRSALADDLDRMGLMPDTSASRPLRAVGGVYPVPPGVESGLAEPFEPVEPERRTVGVEVLTDELRNPPVDPDIDEALKMIWIPPHARVGIVLRADGQLLAVVETDADWIKRHGPVALLTRLLQQAEHYARDGDAELLMPTPDVLAALDGRPDATFWTAPIPVMHRDMKAGWLLISYADEGESVPAGTERQEPIEAVTDCTPEAVDGVHPAAYATDCRVLTVAGTPCHFDNWLTNLVRIPAAVTR